MYTCRCMCTHTMWTMRCKPVRANEHLLMQAYETCQLHPQDKKHFHDLNNVLVGVAPFLRLGFFSFATSWSMF